MPPTSVINSAKAYDGLGRLYDRYWQSISMKLLPAFERLVIGSLPRGSRVLDVCCGTGHLAAALGRRGARVVALDGSEDMLKFARVNAPKADLVLADARQFHFRESFAAAVSSGDSMNHMLTIHDLRSAFTNTLSALTPGGKFVFDMNMAEAFETQWRKSSTVVGTDHLIHVRGSYEKPERLGTTEVTLFSVNGNWTRTDLRMYQRCYRIKDVRALLEEVGFVNVTAHSAKSLGLKGRLAVGRTFFSAQKAA